MIRPRSGSRRRGSRIVITAGLAGFGSQLATVTAAWVLVEAGASPILVTVLYACGSTPQLLFGLPAGVLGDRIGHRISVVWSGIGATLILVALAASIAISKTHVAIVLVAAVLVASADTLRQANVQALSGPLGGPASLASLNWVSRVSTLGGALLAGGLYSVIGPAWVFILAALSYTGATFALQRRPSVHPRSSRASSRGLRSAAGLLRAQPMIRQLVLVVMAVETFLFSTLALLPTFTHRVLGGGSETLGLLTGCVSGGGVIALSALRHMPRTRHWRLLLGALVVGPVALLGQSVGTTLFVTCMALLIFGGALASIDVSSQALMQLLAPADQRGALGGLWVVAVGSAPLGQIGSGMVASVLGVRGAIAVFGGSALAFGVAVRRSRLFAYLRSDGVLEARVPLPDDGPS